MFNSIRDFKPAQTDKDSEMETLRSTQQELDALQAKVRRKEYFGKN